MKSVIEKDVYNQEYTGQFTANGNGWIHIPIVNNDRGIIITKVTGPNSNFNSYLHGMPFISNGRYTFKILEYDGATKVFSETPNVTFTISYLQ